jgi:membrane-associated PAP2 superfamily phosphatase
MLFLLIIDPTRLDFFIAHLMYQPHKGFIGGDSWFLETVLHDRGKQLLIGFALCTLMALIVSNWVGRLRPWRRSLGYLMLAFTLSVGVVPVLKKITRVHCPWSLKVFGGTEQYSSLLSPRPVTAKPGRCWPGGHATGGFSLLALFFVFRDYWPKVARAALLFAITLGIIFSIGRMLQGAHFLSHNLWTALLDWLICLGLYRAILYRPDLVVST